MLDLESYLEIDLAVLLIFSLNSWDWNGVVCVRLYVYLYVPVKSLGGRSHLCRGEKNEKFESRR